MLDIAVQKDVAEGELHQINRLLKNSKGLVDICLASDVEDGQRRPVELPPTKVFKHDVR